MNPAFAHTHRQRALGTMIGLLAGCAQSQGETVLVVDTDLPVPQIVSRLRVDLFASDGAWFDSRDFTLPNPSDWPTSFAITNDNPDRDKVVLVRLRAYPFGRERDYQGERFTGQPAYIEPFAAQSLDEMCSSPPVLKPGEVVTVRRGRAYFSSIDCDGFSASVGASAVAVQIAESGPYTLGVLHVDDPHSSTMIEVRSDCMSYSAEAPCASATETPGGAFFTRPTVTVNLAGPQRYFLIVSGKFWPDGPADVTVGVARADAWEDLPYPAPAPEPVAGQGLPRLLRTSKDGTVQVESPGREPQPPVSIDRLALVRVPAQARGAARIDLRGECSGTMARFNARAPEDPSVVVAEAETCVDHQALREPVAELPLSPTASWGGTSAQGSFGLGEGCPPSDPASETVCLQGRPLLLGNNLGSTISLQSPSPERIAVVSRFWIDRHEVTVADWRRAWSAGFRPKPFPGQRMVLGPWVNDGPLGLSVDDELTMCSYSTTPRRGDESRESFGLSCVYWYDARDYCQWRGGDLPTEAQYEFAAVVAGRPFRTRYVWGNAPPSCTSVVFGRSGLSEQSDACINGSGPGSDHAFGPAAAPLTAEQAGQDVTPDGVVGLAGGLREWTLDAAASYDSTCWQGAGLNDPSCRQQEAPNRATRGAAWRDPAWVLDGASRSKVEAQAFISTVGFRCAFRSEPTR